MSNYIDIVFKHPKNITDDEIESIYKYSIRFSDHKHEENEIKPNTLHSVHIVGMKPKNFEKAARSAFNKYLDKAQERISNFEVKKFGKKITNLR